ncbi:MAG: PEP-CTERM sorting domain-containing protein [Nitrospirales bacterium]|nr:PEP-CTERM sorting domain-containing protein [Nitrospira sp.]MDR4459409.1 PEP-CTERM sorting domain-containing protein [Nitrospirales bacterium]MDR4483498.1 PEP-CTERM sorting domain-containing protein [Nitrospirales bacterium]
MNATRLFKMLLGVAFVFGLVGQAHADPMLYAVNGTLSGGGQITGSMEIDSDGGPGNYIVPTTWMFMTSGGVDPNGSPISNFTYSPTSSSLLFDLALLTFIGTDFSTGRSLTFAGYSPLLNQPGPYAIGSITETYKYSNSFQILGRTFTHDEFATRDGSGSVASLPEPSSAILLGSGLAALGALRYRKGKKV